MVKTSGSRSCTHTVVLGIMQWTHRSSGRNPNYRKKIYMLCGLRGSGTKRHLQYHPGIIRVYLTEILGRMSFVSRADRCQECHQRSMQGNSIQTEFTRTESKVISSITEQPIMHLGITQGTHQP